MYQNQYDTLLHTKKLPKSVMFYGEVNYYIDKYIDLTTEKIAATNVQTFFYEDFDFTAAKDALSQGSLFGDITAVVYKSEKNLAKEQLKQLLHICQKNDNSYFIYAIYNPKKSALTSLFTQKNSAAEVRFFDPKPHVAVAELTQKADSLKMQITKSSLEHLYSILNYDLALAMNELHKLAIVDGEIDHKEIDNLVYATSAVKIENLFYDLMDKKPILEHIMQLLESGDDSYKILRQAQYFFQQLFMFRCFIALKGFVDSKEIIGYKLPKFVEEKKASYAQKLKILEYEQLLSRLCEAEIELKKSDALQREALLVATFLNLQQFAK
ncbi:MAG: DNA polymerase III subunit delta [Campylobacterota bacterium]